MTITDLRKTPFPWFGGKREAAEHIWSALGDVPHYVEPFGGGLACLLHRPHPANRAYYSETVNDLDGLLVNAWRSIAYHSEATASAASWPVSEADLHARHLAILDWKDAKSTELLMGDPYFCDPRIGGWWLWGQSAWIGSGWCSGKGPWCVGDDGRITKRGNGGVQRNRPQLGDNGRGVNHAGLREPGVNRQLPHLGNDGRGVNRPQLREPGVGDYHAMTMPELLRWFAFLSARLRHVRILNGDWKRACTTGAAFTIPVRQGNGPAGVFLDPPYADTAGRASGCYAEDSLDVAHEAREWALSVGGDPKWRIVFAGYEGEHGGAFEAAGWRAVEWFKGGFLAGGMGQIGKGGHQQDRERLWCSPHCLGAEPAAQGELF